MKINSISVGGWFQRTTLQLSEIYDFLRGEAVQVKLETKKLDAFREKLEITDLEYGSSGEEFLVFSTTEAINVKIFEDGLIVLNNTAVSENTLLTDIEKVKDYYETRLSPTLNYLFSLGAPVPKELAGIKNIYPFFVVMEKATSEEIQNLLAKTEGRQYFEFKNPKYDVLRGNKYYFINNKTKSSDEIERYIEEQIFIREFKGQLHRYLNIHRIIWEKIDDVKAHSKVKGSEIVKFTTKLEGYAKTINLIDGRINQMGTYLPTREIYFFVLALIGWGSQKILSVISSRQKYDVTDVEYEKNIK